MKHFRIYNKETVLSLTKMRKFETRVGERVKVLPPDVSLEEGIKSVDCKYILIGIPEDIGVRANYGIGGADSAWFPFLSSFLNTQSNSFFPADNILLLGDFDFGDVLFLINNTIDQPEERVEAYRHAVASIDTEVERILKIIAEANRIPVIVGGGHNNSYPIIRGVAKGLHQCGVLSEAKLNCVNLDAHTDYKVTEGRHSGNSFRYAVNSGYLKKYSVIGMHENYVPQNVLMDMHQQSFTQYISFEDIFIRENLNFNQALAVAVNFMEDAHVGVELDVDCIQHALASAETPVGVHAIDARRFVHYVTSRCNPAYFHVCEGAAQLANGKKRSTTGKLLSYLVTDFIKAAEQGQ